MNQPNSLVNRQGKNPLLPWIFAIRPKTLTASLVPVLVGSSLASSVQWGWSLLCLVVAFCIQIGTNLVNDALDFKRGADTKNRLGPSRATQNGWLSQGEVLGAGILFFALASMFSIPILIKGGWPFYLIMLTSVICGYLYTGTSKPLAYVGLGEVFVLLFFGWVATVGVYYLQTFTIDVWAFLAGTEIGLLSVLLLAINNFRDHFEDSLSFKKTLIVRFGKKFGRLEISSVALLPFILHIFWFFHGNWLAAGLPLLLLPYVGYLLFQVWNTDPGRRYNSFLGQAALIHLLYGFLFILGLLKG